MLDIAVLAGIGVSFASVLLVFGCVCQLFKKSPPGFSVRLYISLVPGNAQFEIFDFKNSRFLKGKKNLIYIIAILVHQLNLFLLQI